jgi:DNA invertase Pin-like site-specific DNA recombinase
MLIGYARVSTDDQKLNLQQDALRAAGCEQIFEDYLSGSKAARPGLDSALEIARAGDTLVVWRLDRLGRSLKDLIELTETLKERSIGLNSLQEAINTRSSSGQLVFHTRLRFKVRLCSKVVNRPVRSRTPGGVGGGIRKDSPYPD